MFTNRRGRPIQATEVIKQFHAALDAAGVRRARFHDCRHTLATFLLLEGVAPRVAMEVLGHSEIALTLNTYSHVLPEQHRAAARRIDDLLARRPDEPSRLEPVLNWAAYRLQKPSSN